jgi:hypothetical protein
MRHMGNRLLGAVGLLTSPMLLVQAALSGFNTAPSSRLNALLGLAFLVGWACSVIGLRQLRATGRGLVASVLWSVQLVGLGLAALQQIQDFVYTSASPQTAFYAACDAAWPLSAVFMLVVGAFTTAARVLTSWRRWTPSLCGLAVPLLIMVRGTAGQQEGIWVFGIYTWVTWALLGIAVRTSSAGTAPN